MTAHLAPGEPVRPPPAADEPTSSANPLPWYRRPVTIRLLLVLTLFTCVLAYAEKAACRDTRNWSDQFQYTRMCYSDVVALYSAEGLNKGDRPYLDAPVEYPVLIGAAMQAAAEVSYLAPEREAGGQDLRVAVFSDATALLLTLAAGAVVACTALTAGRRPRDALLVALAPALVLHAFTNWDLLAVAFAAGALLAWSRQAPSLAGVLLGLGAATKLYPILFLVPLFLLCLRAGQLRAWARAAGWAVAVLVLVNLPVYLAAGYFTEDKAQGPGVGDVLSDGGGLGAALAPHHPVGLPGGGEVATNALLRFLDLNSERVADWDSLAFALQYLASSFSPDALAPVHLIALAVVAALTTAGIFAVRTKRGLVVAAGVGGASLVVVALGLPPLLRWTREQGALPVGGLNVVTALLFVVALAGLSVFVLRLPTRPRVAQVVFLTVVAFLLTNKVFSPQYVLWVVPLAALALPRWRPFLLWQLTEALVLVTRYLYFADAGSNGARGIDLGWFVGAVALRDVALLVLAVLVVRDMRRPESDPVRVADAAGDDPGGGVLVGAPDRAFRRPRTAPTGRATSVPADVVG